MAGPTSAFSHQCQQNGVLEPQQEHLVLAGLGHQLQGKGCMRSATNLALLAHVMLSNMLLHTKLDGEHICKA